MKWLAWLLILTLMPTPALAQANLRSELEKAVEEKQWRRAIAIVDRLIELNPAQVSQLKEYRKELLAISTNRTPAPSVPPTLLAQATPPPALPVSSATTTTLIAQSLQLITDGNLAGAIEVLDQVIAKDPLSASAHQHRGLAYYQQGNLSQAIADWTQALGIEPKLAGVALNRGVARYMMEEYEAALTDFDRALQSDPKLAKAHYNRSLVFLQQENYEAALEAANQAIQIDTKLAGAYQNRGIARYHLGDQQAIADFTLAIESNADLPWAYQNRGFIRIDLLEDPGGISDLQKAADLFLETRKTDLYQQTLSQIRQLQDSLP